MMPPSHAPGVSCVLAALYGGDQDRQAQPFLFGLATACAAGPGFVLAWSAWLWRGWQRPYLTLDENGVRSPGFTGTVRWLDMSALGVSAAHSPTTWFVLRPGASLPRRTGPMRRLRIDENNRAVQFMAVLPRGLDEEAFRNLLRRYAKAAHARQALAADNLASGPEYAGAAVGVRTSRVSAEGSDTSSRAGCAD